MSSETTSADKHPTSPLPSPTSKKSKMSDPTSTSTTLPTASPSPLQIQLLTPSATAPTRGSLFAAGYDLYASSACTIPAKGKALISTGIAIAVPPGTYGRVAPRSGLAVKKFVDVGAGVIDEDYRGEVRVLLFNFDDDLDIGDIVPDFDDKIGDDDDSDDDEDRKSVV